jgi:signal recognition particle GTPase
VNRLLKQFTEMQRMMKMISGGKMPRTGGGIGALLGR